jgi:hypothetical protein
MENYPTKLDKALKISIIAGILIVGLSVAYYLVVFLPQKEAARIEELKKQQAIKEEQQKQEQLIKEATSKSDEWFVKNNECQKYKTQVEEKRNEILGAKVVSGVFYSSKTNSCLYVVLDFDDEFRIRDASTGQLIFHENIKDMKGNQVGDEINNLIENYK